MTCSNYAAHRKSFPVGPLVPVESLTAEGLLTFSATHGKTTLSDSGAIAKAHEAKGTKVNASHTHKTKAWFGLV